MKISNLGSRFITGVRTSRISSQLHRGTLTLPSFALLFPSSTLQCPSLPCPSLPRPARSSFSLALSGNSLPRSRLCPAYAQPSIGVGGVVKKLTVPRWARTSSFHRARPRTTVPGISISHRSHIPLKDGPGSVMVSDTLCPAVHILGT